MTTLNGESEEKKSNAIVPARIAASAGLAGARAGIALISPDGIEHLRRNLGVSQSASEMIRDMSASVSRLVLGVTDSAGGISAQQDSLWAAVGAARLDSERARGQVSKDFAAVQQWRQEEIRVAFERLQSWRQPWPELIPRQWRVYEPEPPADEIEVVQTDDQLTLESLSVAIAEGRLPWREVLKLAMQHMPNTKPGVKAPEIAEQLALVEGWYAVRGSKKNKRSSKGLDTLQQGYCDKVGISRATLNRYERTCKALGLL